MFSKNLEAGMQKKFMGSKLIVYAAGRPQTYTMVLNRTGNGEPIHDIAKGNLADLVSGLKGVGKADLNEMPSYRSLPENAIKILEWVRQGRLSA